VSRYARGRALEWEVRAIFEAAGWSVIRGAGSKGEVDGMKADLVASRRGTKNADDIYIVVLQAKRSRR
jgi:Holliday junction resolvase